LDAKTCVNYSWCLCTKKLGVFRDNRYVVYVDPDTFRPVAKFQETFPVPYVGAEPADAFGIHVPLYLHRLKHDPPFDFCGAIEEWKRCLEAVVRLELLAKSPDWRMIRVGARI
jgi:hypothetical protein